MTEVKHPESVDLDALGDVLEAQIGRRPGLGCRPDTEGGYAVSVPSDPDVTEADLRAALDAYVAPEPTEEKPLPQRIADLEAENASLRDAVDTLVLDSLKGGTA